MGILKVIFLITTLSVSTLAQDFSGLKKLDGSPTAIETTHNKLLVYFWATWCSECRGHIKNMLPKLQEKNKFEIITIVMDKDLERATQYITKESVKLKAFRDPDKKLSGPLKVFSVPVWAVFEKQKNEWKLVASQAGSDDQQMLKALGENLGEKK